jgi:ATP-dependent helicase HrpB
MFTSDPALRGVGAVVFDEFHERHIDTDLGLALAKAAQSGPRPDLKIVVMSATLDAEPVAKWLGDVPRIRSEGRCFDVGMEFLLRPDRHPLHELAAAAYRDVIKAGGSGHVLIFLPGAADISRTAEALRTFAADSGVDVLPLHGEMRLEDQVRAVEQSDRRKVILSTNIAETSVTIDGVGCVIDGGLSRVAGYSPWSGLPGLSLQKISKASAAQRAGRAGRTGPGTAIRLYTKEDFDSRPQFSAPEIMSSDLSGTVLLLLASGIADPSAFGWFQPPPKSALDAATRLLERIGAIDGSGLTMRGRKIASLPVHPRLGALVVEGASRCVAAECCKVAALISERDIRLETRAFTGGARARSAGSSYYESDLLDMLDILKQSAGRHRAPGVDQRALENVIRLSAMLEKMTPERGQKPSGLDHEKAILISILAAFPDRVAKRRKDRSPEVILSGGGSATIPDSCSVQNAGYLVAIDAGERVVAGGKKTIIRLASAVEPEWLADLFGDRLVERTGYIWNPTLKRVDGYSTINYDALPLVEGKPGEIGANAETERILLREASAMGVAFFDRDGRAASTTAKIATVALAFPELKGAGADIAMTDQEILAAACSGRRSFRELEGLDFGELVASRHGGNMRELLRRNTPEKLALPNGRSVPIHYEAGKPPWIESYLQDFFGMAVTPTVCSGRVAITVNLLAPSRRPVQVTSDLAGFWRNHYPSIRKELCRKYPRHKWPEDGGSSKPPELRRRSR